MILFVYTDEHSITNIYIAIVLVLCDEIPLYTGRILYNRVWLGMQHSLVQSDGGKSEKERVLECIKHI